MISRNSANSSFRCCVSAPEQHLLKGEREKHKVLFFFNPILLAAVRRSAGDVTDARKSRPSPARHFVEWANNPTPRSDPAAWAAKPRPGEEFGKRLYAPGVGRAIV